MNCEEFEELSGAYAIGALPDEERAAAEEHLSTCDKHPEMSELLAVAGSLAAASPPLDPPPELKLRLMEAIRAEAEQPIGAIETEAPRGTLLDTLRGWLAGPRLGYGLAAAMSVLVMGLLAWNIVLQTDDGNGEAFVVEMTGQVTGQVVYSVDGKVAFMELQGMDDLPPDKVYEVWAVARGRVVPLGTIVPRDGEAKAAMEFDAAEFDNIAITIENAPGVDQPTSDPITISEEL